MKFKIKSFAINFSLILLGLIIGLLIIEGFLEANSWVYKKVFYKRILQKDNKEKGDNKCKFLFIGDSWTEGGEAPPGKGFPEQFIKLLSDKNPDKNYFFLNISYHSSNSSWAVLKLLEELSKNKFDYVFLLTGLNNGWNAEDVEKIDQIAFDMFGRKPLGDKIKTNIFFKVGLKRIGKLFAIYNYQREIFKVTENIKYKDRDSIYVKLLCDLELSVNSFNITKDAYSRIRDILMENHKLAKDYDEFYKVIKLTFDNKHFPTEEFLKSKNMWKPGLIRNLTLEKKREKYLDLACNILERDLKLIVSMCREHKIKPILLTYPGKTLNFFCGVNDVIRKVAMEEKISLIDQDKSFKNNFKSDKELREVFGSHHPNEKGYAFMAENMLQFFVNYPDLQL
jgi:hypothetical protein